MMHIFAPSSFTPSHPSLLPPVFSRLLTCVPLLPSSLRPLFLCLFSCPFVFRFTLSPYPPHLVSIPPYCNPNGISSAFLILNSGLHNSGPCPNAGPVYARLATPFFVFSLVSSGLFLLLRLLILPCRPSSWAIDAYLPGL
jgi:hypothetical protein